MPNRLAGWRGRELAALIGLALAMLLLWHVPGLGLLFYPFRVFGTFVHEISHGLAAIATGGTFHRFVVNPDLSGIAWSAGGWTWIITSAGYIGSAVFGGVLVLLMAWRMKASTILFWVGISLGLLCLLFVRNIFGIASGLVLATALITAARRLPVHWASGLLLVLAVQLMLGGIESLFGLVQLSAGSQAVTDATIMAQSTGVPALVWAMVWTTVSLGVLLSTLRLAYR